MQLQRILLLFIFTFSIYSLWDAWHREQQPKVIQDKVSAIAPDVPVASPALTAKKPDAIAKSVAVSKSAPAAANAETLVVKTNFLRAEISTLGGDITKIELLKHFDTSDKTKPFVIFQNDNTHKYVAQSGLLGSGLPTHNTIYSSIARSYELSEGQDEIEVKLSTVDSTGVKVNKFYKFHKNSYLIDTRYEVESRNTALTEVSAYFQLVRDESAPGGGSMFVPTYTGPAIYTDKAKFTKIDFSAIAKGKAEVPETANNGWAGMLQHYFVSAWIPSGNANREFYVKQIEDKIYSVGLILPVEVAESGKSASISVPLYVGPAQSKLDDIAEGLGLTVDYGFLTVIAKPIFALLGLLHDYVGNWGIAIIILTILIKLVFFPLSAASYRSMAKMRVVAPKLTKMREQYAHDRERLNRAMMDLYKTEKINPLGGCLPILIQIPVFIALYWSILSSVEMRYAPFFGWITDLSKEDPYYVLPVIMGVSMIIQTKLNPTPPDPIQAKMMQIMPIVFSVVFFFFPAGLVLYSIVNNVLSILQQWYITRNTESEAKGAHKN